MRKEVDLARAEIKQEIRLAGKAAGALGGAGGAAYIVVLLLSFALAWVWERSCLSGLAS